MYLRVTDCAINRSINILFKQKPVLFAVRSKDQNEYTVCCSETLPRKRFFITISSMSFTIISFFLMEIYIRK